MAGCPLPSLSNAAILMVSCSPLRFKLFVQLRTVLPCQTLGWQLRLRFS